MKNLCFRCDRPITDDNKIAINSITHQGMKFHINQLLEGFKQLISDISDYDPKHMHLSCYEIIERKLSPDRK